MDHPVYCESGGSLDEKRPRFPNRKERSVLGCETESRTFQCPAKMTCRAVSPALVLALSRKNSSFLVIDHDFDAPLNHVKSDARAARLPRLSHATPLIITSLLTDFLRHFLMRRKPDVLKLKQLSFLIVVIDGGTFSRHWCLKSLLLAIQHAATWLATHLVVVTGRHHTWTLPQGR